jgi:hypothetical protein
MGSLVWWNNKGFQKDSKYSKDGKDSEIQAITKLMRIKFCFIILSSIIIF